MCDAKYTPTFFTAFSFSLTAATSQGQPSSCTPLFQGCVRNHQPLSLSLSSRTGHFILTSRSIFTKVCVKCQWNCKIINSSALDLANDVGMQWACSSWSFFFSNHLKVHVNFTLHGIRWTMNQLTSSFYLPRNAVQLVAVQQWILIESSNWVQDKWLIPRRCI